MKKITRKAYLTAKLYRPGKVGEGYLGSRFVGEPDAEGKIYDELDRDTNLGHFLYGNKVQNKDGDHVPVYHITPKSFSRFKPGGDDPSLSGPVIFLSPRRDHLPAAHNVGSEQRGYEEGTNVMPLWVNLKNPLVLDDYAKKKEIKTRLKLNNAFPMYFTHADRQALIDEGYDGVINGFSHVSGIPHVPYEFGKVGVGDQPHGEEEIVAFHPNQLKSATGNQGTYDPDEDDINKAGGGEVDGWEGAHVREAQHFADGGVAGAPQKTVKAYKLFKTKKSAPGKLFPLFVDANTPVPVGQWVDAKAGEPGKTPGKVKSKLGDLAFRPGWHAGDLPIATHIGGRSSDEREAPPDYRPADQVWAEVEMPDDVDWQSVANSRGQRTKANTIDPKTAAITDQVPYGGHYRYKTNPNMTGNWMIGGSMKVNRVLSDDEVQQINDAAGVADLPRHPDYPAKAAGGRTGYADGGAPKLNTMGFYSKAAQIARSLPMQKANAAQMIAMLADPKRGAKKDELVNAGLMTREGKPHPDLAGTVTSEELANHLERFMPQLGETEYGELKREPKKRKWDDEIYRAMAVGDYEDAERLKAEERAYQSELAAYERYLNSRAASGKEPTKFDQYTLPGGDNYREVLLHTPENNQNFKSSHWPETPNVVAHLRMKDRTGPNGEKVLHVEEIQSDWGQKGRDEGFDTPENRAEKDAWTKKYHDLHRELISAEQARLKRQQDINHNFDWGETFTLKGDDFEDATNEINRYNDALENDAEYTEHANREEAASKALNAHRAAMPKGNIYPTGPYVTSTEGYTDLALKRALQEAVKGGYDKLVVSPGQANADHYGLEKNFSKIAYNPRLRNLTVWPHGQSFRSIEDVTPENLSNQIGHELSKKLLSTQQEEDGNHFLEGDGLRTGGEGMRKYYDKDVPQRLQKLAGSMDPNAKVDMFSHPLPAKEDAPSGANGYMGHSLDITDKMRDTVNQGLPAFKRGGEVEEPKSTVKAYKLFKTKKNAPGQLFPLFVNANTPVPIGKWVDAEAGPAGKNPEKVKSKLGDLAFRPGWHGGDLPVATHIGGRSHGQSTLPPDYRPADQVWAEVEMPNDVDWQSVANSRVKTSKTGQPIASTAHITDQVPFGGHYRYKTNPNMTGNWLIGGSMKVNRVLSDDEVKAINDAAGVADLPRHPDYPAKADGGEVNGGVNLDMVHDALQRVVSPFSSDPEVIRQALDIANKTHRIQTGNVWTGQSYFGHKGDIAPQDVQSTVESIPNVTPKPKKEMSWEDVYNQYKGGHLVPLGGDRSRLGRLTHINGKQLSWPVDLHAGSEYMQEPNEGAVWANAAGQTSKMQKFITELSDKGPVVGAFTPMGPKTVDSSFQMMDAILSQIAASNPDKSVIKKFDDDMRSGIFAEAADRPNVVAKMMKWPGLSNVQEAREFLKNTPGTIRSMIVKHLDKASWNKAGFPHIGITRAAITNPDLLSAQGNMIGHRVAELIPGAVEPKSFVHNTYKGVTGGRYIGDVPLVQRQYALPDVMEKLLSKRYGTGQNVILHPYTPNPGGRSGFRKIIEEQKNAQPINQKMLDSIMTGLERQKEYGFKQGGAVDSAMELTRKKRVGSTATHLAQKVQKR